MWAVFFELSIVTLSMVKLAMYICKLVPFGKTAWPILHCTWLRSN